MPTTSKPKRVTLNCTLPPDLAAALQREANERMINASILVERALLAFLQDAPTAGSRRLVIIRIATTAFDSTAAVDTRDDALVSVRTPWVEIGDHRLENVLGAKVETNDGIAEVTITFYGAVEMVLLDSRGNIIAMDADEA